ncbi:MAG: response regulator transcription factor [Clostridiaceae bacterium]
MAKLIYIADDDANIRKLIEGFLVKEGYTVRAFSDGETLLTEFKHTAADLVILDVMMPGRDGFMITEDLRKLSTVPIILLTARDTDTDFILGISLGSDDYITKPFSPMTLTMRVRAIFRRIDMDQRIQMQSEIEFEDITINLEQKRVTVADQEIDLAPNEYALLKYLIEHKERAISREELLDKVWGYTTVVETRVTDDTLKRLRKKIINSQVLIETIWGFGFRLKKRDGHE